MHKRTVTGMLDEMYSGLHYMEQISDSRLYVAKVIQRIRSYGFAFKKGDIFAWPAEDCIRNLILHRREDVYTLIKEYMDEIEVSPSDIVLISVVLFLKHRQIGLLIFIFTWVFRLQCSCFEFLLCLQS